MAEIVRAGIISVDAGQSDAAQALGMTRLQTMRRIVLPQAMRVIVPPTGNEAISMLKTTSIVSVIAYTDLLYSVQLIYSANYQQVPLLIVACIWYLAFTTLLSIGQHFLERRLARGSARMTEPAVRIEAVHKRFGGTEVLRGISLAGPAPARCSACSGPRAPASRRCCAASTTSRRSTRGGCGSTASSPATARWATRSTSCREREVARKRAQIGMVFQRFNLFAHLTALQNVAEAPMRVRGLPAPEAQDARARALLAQVGLSDKLARVPGAAVRRPAAAGGDRPRAGDGPEADALRRADLGARPRARRRGARRHAPARARRA